MSEATSSIFSEIARKVEDARWFKFVRLCLVLTEEQIMNFKQGFVPEEYMFEIIRKKCEQDRMWLCRHRDLLPPEKRAACLDPNRVDEQSLREAIYGIIASLPLKERRRFCKDEVGIDPPKMSDCPVPQGLKMEMLDMYWEEEGKVEGGINGGRPQTVEKLLEQAEEFLKENKEYAKKKRQTTVDNLFVACKEVKMYLTTNTEFLEENEEGAKKEKLTTIGNLFVNCKVKMYLTPNTD